MSSTKDSNFLEFSSILFRRAPSSDDMVGLAAPLLTTEDTISSPSSPLMMNSPSEEEEQQHTTHRTRSPAPAGRRRNHRLAAAAGIGACLALVGFVAFSLIPTKPGAVPTSTFPTAPINYAQAASTKVDLRSSRKPSQESTALSNAAKTVTQQHRQPSNEEPSEAPDRNEASWRDAESDADDAQDPGSNSSSPDQKAPQSPPLRPCGCEENKPNAGCTRLFDLELATPACRFKPAMRLFRRDQLCRMESINRALGRVPRSAEFRVQDSVAKSPCEGGARDANKLHIEDPAAVKSEYKQLEARLKAADVLPMLVAAPALRPLWELPQDDLFYTKDNMQSLRGMGQGQQPSGTQRDPFTQASAEFLPSKAPQNILRFDTCAVVGNDGALMKRGQGQEIDAHSRVFRVNQAPTNPRVERHVGKKTSVRVLNRAWSRHYSGDSKWLLDRDPKGMLLLSSRATTKTIDKLGTMFHRGRHRDKWILFPTSEMVASSTQLVQGARMVLQEVLGYTYLGGNMPSSGLVSVFLALQMCRKVGVYGFSLRNCEGPSCPTYHYFRSREVPDKPMKRGFKGHQYDVEGMILRAWHTMGVACIVPEPPLLGECGSGFGGLINQDGNLTDDAAGLLETDPGSLLPSSIDLGAAGHQQPSHFRVPGRSMVKAPSRT